MKTACYIFIFLISSFASAQVKGIVVDEFNQPISYVNIYVENENSSTTSEENGEFAIHCAPEKNLIFSALGYEKKTVLASEAEKVILKSSTVELSEIVIEKRFGTKELEIGKVKIESYQAFENGPRIDCKFFPYDPKYKKTKYIKQLTIMTDSRLENTSFKIHFYAVNEDGSPGKELLKKDYLVTVKKGVKKSYFNVSDFSLRMPKNGVFVGFEKLLIEENISATSYYPFMLYNYVQREFVYVFSKGTWIKQTKEDISNPSDKMMVYEPAINLILTN